MQSGQIIKKLNESQNQEFAYTWQLCICQMYQADNNSFDKIIDAMSNLVNCDAGNFALYKGVVCAYFRSLPFNPRIKDKEFLSTINKILKFINKEFEDYKSFQNVQALLRSQDLPSSNYMNKKSSSAESTNSDTAADYITPIRNITNKKTYELFPLLTELRNRLHDKHLSIGQMEEFTGFLLIVTNELNNRKEEELMELLKTATVQNILAFISGYYQFMMQGEDPFSKSAFISFLQSANRVLTKKSRESAEVFAACISIYNEYNEIYKMEATSYISAVDRYIELLKNQIAIGLFDKNLLNSVYKLIETQVHISNTDKQTVYIKLIESLLFCVEASLNANLEDEGLPFQLLATAYDSYMTFILSNSSEFQKKFTTLGLQVANTMYYLADIYLLIDCNLSELLLRKIDKMTHLSLDESLSQKIRILKAKLIDKKDEQHNHKDTRKRKFQQFPQDACITILDTGSHSSTKSPSFK